MPTEDLMLTKLHELPWPVLRNICLFLDEDDLRELLDVPQLQEMMLDLLCGDKIKILPAQQQVDVRWDRFDIMLNKSTIDDFFKTYPNVNPRIYSVGVQGNYTRDVTTCLHERLNRAEAIEVWSLWESREESPNMATAHDLALLLSYPGIQAVDLDKKTVHDHGTDLAFLIPQITLLQSLKLEIDKRIKLPFLSRLQHLTSLELFVDQYTVEEDEDEGDFDASLVADSTHKMLCKVFSQDAIPPRLSTCNLQFPPLLKTLQLKGMSLKTVEVSSLPPTLESLDLSDNEIHTFRYDKNKPWWPVNLKTINLQSNRMGDGSLKQLLCIKWPPALETLNLLGNYFPSLENLRNLPDSITKLTLSGNLMTLRVSHNPDGYPFFRFPKSLRKFSLNPQGPIARAMYYADEHVGLKGRITFPLTLEHLSLKYAGEQNCLRNLLFPSSLKKLCLREMGLKNLNVYNSLPGDNEDVNWTQLTNLKELILSTNPISTLAQWHPPKLLRFLDLLYNKIASLESALTPLFNEECRNLTRNITYIDLEANRIKTIDHNVHLPENLRVINLSMNRISKFAFNESFASHSSLIKIDLRLNLISKLYVQNQTETYASQLRILDLQGNRKAISSAAYSAAFQQLGLKPRKFRETWDAHCRYGVFHFEHYTSKETYF